MATQTSRRLEHDAQSDTAPGRTLLVGYDGSKEARAAFITAIGRAGPDDRVVVVTAHEPVGTWLGSPYYERAVEDNVRTGLRFREELLELAADSPVTLGFEQHEGPPAEVLARVASMREVDEIVVGSRGIGRIRAALGSVSRELLRTADRPVLIVPHRVTDDLDD